MKKTTEELLKDMENLEGELPFSLTNDFFFKYLLQTDNNSLKALVASYLSLYIDDISSVTYLCRSFDSLKKGENYLKVKGVIQIGFLDYTLFPDAPEFYSTNMMMNVKNHKIYSSLLMLSVVDLISTQNINF